MPAEEGPRTLPSDAEREAAHEALMEERGRRLVEYLNLPPELGGPGEPDDDETARPSPFRRLADRSAMAVESDDRMGEHGNQA